MKKEESEEKAKEAHIMKKDSEDKEEEEKDLEQDNKKKNDNQHPVSGPSPSIITLHSPPLSPLPSLRTRKSPSPPLHSLPDSPNPDGPSHGGHGGFSPPPADSSLDSSISDDHFPVRDGVRPIIDERFSPAAAPVVVAHRFQVEPKVVTKVDPGAEEGFVGVKDVEEASGSGRGSGNRRLRPDVTVMLRSQKVAMLSKVLLGLRITAFMFCLISLSVLAADKEQGWALDSFYLYKEFRQVYDLT